MTRIIPVALQTHLETTSRTLAVCVHVTRVDGVEVFATSHDRNLLIDGDTYLALGFLRKDITVADSMDVGTTDIEGILESSSITEDDIRAGKWDGFTWEMFRVNYTDDPIEDRINLGSGTAGVCRWGRLRWIVELLSLMQAVMTQVGYLTSPSCIHKFGKSEGGNGLGNGCTFDLTTITDSGTVELMDTDFYGLHDSARTEPDVFYSGGTFRVLTGDAAGEEFQIRAYIVGYWVLVEPLPYDVTGEDYEIIPGCDKSLEACLGYDQILDRLAFDFLQGNDAAIQVGRHK